MKKIQTDNGFMVINIFSYRKGLIDKGGITDAYKNLTSEEHAYYSTKSDEEQYYLVTVSNTEVEDHHSYFVGKHGIWVHDASLNNQPHQ